MAKTDLWEVDKELVHFLRRNISDPSGRGTTTLEQFNGDGSNTRFELANAAFHTVVVGTSDGGRREYGYGYALDYSSNTGTAAVIFGTSPNSGTNNVSILYHHGDTWIHPDLPFKKVGMSEYPRIGMETISSAMAQIGLGTGMTRTSMLKDIVVYAENVQQLRGLVNDVKNSLINNKDQFYNMIFVQPVGMGPVNKEPDRHEKIVSQNITVEIPFIFET